MITINPKLNNTVVVYVSTFDKNLVVGDVEPAIRSEFIQRCTDTLTKQQSYAVWKLLDYALGDCCGYGVEHFHFTISDTGKWICADGVYFSLTHCNNVVSVSVCNHAVGVDIEAVASFISHVEDDIFIRRVLTESEQALFQNVSAEHKAETLAKIWTQKESIFKAQGSGAFIPKSIDTVGLSGSFCDSDSTCIRRQVNEDSFVQSRMVVFNGERYVLSTATCVSAKIQLVQVDI